MLPVLLLMMTQVEPPIVTMLSSLLEENPVPPKVISVPVPSGPPGPESGDMEVSVGVWSAEYSKVQLLPEHDPVISFTTTTT